MLETRTLLFEGITNRMMCMRSDGIGSPLSIMVNILFMVSTLDFSKSAPSRTALISRDKLCNGER